MKKTPFYIFFAAAAMFLMACEPPATNTNTKVNTNTNAAKPAAVAPTADALLAMEKAANEAWIKGDVKHFEDMLDDKFVMHEGGSRMSKAEMLKMIAGNKCEVKDGWKLEDPQMAKINDDTYVMSYKTTMDGNCTMDGKSMKIPSPTRAASVWIRDGEKWKGAFHGETLIIDPKNPPPPPLATAKKEEPKKEANTAANSNAASTGNTAAATAQPASSGNTDALVKLHTSGWEAWKAKDAKKLTEMSTTNLSIVNPLGVWFSGRDAVVKEWTETMKCEGVNNVSLSQGSASALSPTVEILTLKGTADGTCDGQKNGPLYQTAIYVKEGDAWKLAFMFETPAM